MFHFHNASFCTRSTPLWWPGIVQEPGNTEVLLNQIYPLTDGVTIEETNSEDIRPSTAMMLQQAINVFENCIRDFD